MELLPDRTAIERGLVSELDVGPQETLRRRCAGLGTPFQAIQSFVEDLAD